MGFELDLLARAGGAARTNGIWVMSEREGLGLVFSAVLDAQMGVADGDVVIYAMLDGSIEACVVQGGLPGKAKKLK